MSNVLFWGIKAIFEVAGEAHCFSMSCHWEYVGSTSLPSPFYLKLLGNSYPFIHMCHRSTFLWYIKTFVIWFAWFSSVVSLSSESWIVLFNNSIGAKVLMISITFKAYWRGSGKGGEWRDDRKREEGKVWRIIWKDMHMHRWKNNGNFKVTVANIDIYWRKSEFSIAWGNIMGH